MSGTEDARSKAALRADDTTASKNKAERNRHILATKKQLPPIETSHEDG